MHFARVYYSPRGSPTPVEGADLFFARGRPLLVLTWRDRDGERVPEKCIELDPNRLRRASSNGTIYRYEGRVRP
jgi:hypothetical protein